MTNNRGRTLKAVGTFTFFGMTIALVASVRNIPDVAATGWTMFFYMVVVTLIFALPICLMSGEFAGMFPRAGGPELWVTSALSERWGFTTSWLLWVQMFPGMVMVASVIGPLLAITIGHDSLATSATFTLVCILITYWTVSILNIFFDMARLGGRLGVSLGVYLPIGVMFVLGVAAFIKTGIRANSYLGHFRMGELLPFSKSSVATLSFFAAIAFIYTGIELSSVYLPRLKHPTKTYLRGIFMALIFMFAFNTILALAFANNVAAGTIELNNIAQAPIIALKILGLPTWIANVFAASVLIGVVVQLSAWASGPSKTITDSAQRGEYPPFLRFWKTNKFDVAPTVIFTQAAIISMFALLFVLIPGVNSAFLLLVTATAVLYIVVYVLMAIGILRLRKAQPEAERPFKMGSNSTAWTIIVVFLVTAAASTFATLWYQGLGHAAAIVAITVVLSGAPLIIMHFRKESWRTEIHQAMGVPTTSSDAEKVTV
jgi:amino acid transporter